MATSKAPDPIGSMLGLVSSAGADGAPGTTPEELDAEPKIDAGAEAFNAAASELMTAMESKNVGAVAAALKAACEAHYGAEKSEAE